MNRSSSESALQHWLLQHTQALLERAVADVDSTDALYDAQAPVAGERAVITTNQLQALLNMARTQPLKDIKTFIGQRIERREKQGKRAEASFWSALLGRLKVLKEDQVERACTDLGLSAEDTVSRTRAEDQITRAYLRHFVAHCRYRTHYEKADA